MKMLIKRLLSLIPSALPVGLQEFYIFSDDIIELSGPYADEDSMRFAIATMILHLGPQKSRISKNHFVRSLRKTAANQVAGQIFQDIKVKQQEAQKQAEATAKQLEAAAVENSEKEKTKSA